MKTGQSTKWALTLMGGAVIADGLLAGGNIDRLLVATPAWRHIGLVGWADFTRSADLGNGAIVYPAMALGGTALVVLALIVFIVTGRQPRRAWLPVSLAAVLMCAALPCSLLATPYMMSLHHIGDQDPTQLQRAYDGAHYWGRLQSFLHLAAFLAELWAMSALSGRAQATVNVAPV